MKLENNKGQEACPLDAIVNPPCNKVFLMDCMEGMKQYPDKFFDIAIVDPPYRDENQPTKDMRRNGSMNTVIGRPDEEYWEQLYRVSKEQIIWGANNFELPQFKGFVVWRKLTISENFTMSMAEIAAISDGLGTVSKVIEMMPQGTKEDPRIHPTQKPVKLYEWLIKHYAEDCETILDTHVGSGSSRIAAHKAGKSFVGFEIDKDYHEAQEKRFKEFKKQLTLF